jgi:hypothetical protein
MTNVRSIHGIPRLGERCRVTPTSGGLNLRFALRDESHTRVFRTEWIELARGVRNIRDARLS